jgi:hypothetical protein
MYGWPASMQAQLLPPHLFYAGMLGARLACAAPYPASSNISIQMFGAKPIVPVADTWQHSRQTGSIVELWSQPAVSAKKVITAVASIATCLTSAPGICCPT